MAKPNIHAKSSAKKFGGDENDYLAIHDFMDSSKAVVSDNRHRAILHSSFGIFIAQKVFGINFALLNQLKEKYGWTDDEMNDILMWKNNCIEHGSCIKNSNGRQVSVRDIGEQHCLEDFGNRFIPSASDYMDNLVHQPWMSNIPGSVPNSFIGLNGAKNSD